MDKRWINRGWTNTTIYYTMDERIKIIFRCTFFHDTLIYVTSCLRKPCNEGRASFPYHKE